MTIYTMTSKTCKESWPKSRGRWCSACTCNRHDEDCYEVVVRMTTDPGCPTHATRVSPPRKAKGRVVYSDYGEIVYSDYGEKWRFSCLTPKRLQGKNFDAGADVDRGPVDAIHGREGTEEEAIRWLLEEP